MGDPLDYFSTPIYQPGAGGDLSSITTPGDFLSQPQAMAAIASPPILAGPPDLGQALPIPQAPDQIASPPPGLTSAGQYFGGPVTSPDQVSAAGSEPTSEPFARFRQGLAEQEAQQRDPLLRVGRDATRAQEEQKAIAQTEGDVQAQQATEAAPITEQSMREANDQIKKNQLDREAHFAERQRMLDDNNKAVAAYANMKIDPDRYWHNRDTGRKIFDSIGVLFSGVGNYMMGKGGANPVYDSIMQAAKDDVSSQVENRNAAGKVVQMKRDSLDAYEKLTGDKESAANMKVAENLTIAKNQIAAISAKYAPGETKLAAAKTMAQLDAEIAKINAATVTAQQARADKQRELANETARVGIAGGELALRRQQEAEKQREFNLSLGTKEDAARQKIQNEGIADPSTGSVIVDESGKPLLDAADKIDARAAAETDPEKQAALLKLSKQYRTKAEEEHGATITDKDVRAKIETELGGAQSVVNMTDDIRKSLDDSSIFDRAKRGALKTKIESLKANWIKTHEGKPSSREFEAISEMIPSADGYFASNLNRDKIFAQLDALDQATQDDVITTLHSHKIKPAKFQLSAKTGAAETPVLGGQTSVEAGQRAEGNPLGYGGLSAVTGSTPLESENAAPLTPSGLSKPDDAAVTRLIDAYGAKSPEENDRVVGALAGYVSGKGVTRARAVPSPFAEVFQRPEGSGATADEEHRQAISNAVLVRLRENPRLYNAVVKELPKKQRDEILGRNLGMPILDLPPPGWLDKAK